MDYHGIVQWVAEKSKVDEQHVKNLPTYALENKIAEKYFAAMWDKMTYEQRVAVLNNFLTTSNLTMGYLILGGPWGLALAAGLAGIGAFFMGSAEKETVSAFIMTVGMIKAKKFAH